MYPLVSVITAAYNAEKYLSESIESIISQTYQNFELIIINDGSTDNTQEIAENYCKKDSRIKLINNKQNMFVIKSRNIGIQHAKGNYITILDSDDIALPEKLEKQVDFLEKNKSVFLVATNINKIDENNHIIGESVTENSFDEIKLKLEKDNIIWHSTVMFRNTNDIVYREKMIFTEDYDLYLKILTEGKKLFILKDKLLNYRILSTSLSHTNNGIIPWFFINKTKEFYKERLNTGKDSYDSFDPNEYKQIMDSDYKNKKETLLLALKFSFYNSDINSIKFLLKKYKKYYSVSKSYIFYFILSFNKPMFALFRKIYNML